LRISRLNALKSRAMRAAIAVFLLSTIMPRLPFAAASQQNNASDAVASAVSAGELETAMQLLGTIVRNEGIGSRHLDKLIDLYIATDSIAVLEEAFNIETMSSPDDPFSYWLLVRVYRRTGKYKNLIVTAQTALESVSSEESASFFDALLWAVRRAKLEERWSDAERLLRHMDTVDIKYKIVKRRLLLIHVLLKLKRYRLAKLEIDRVKPIIKSLHKGLSYRRLIEMEALLESAVDPEDKKGVQLPREFLPITQAYIKRKIRALKNFNGFSSDELTTNFIRSQFRISLFKQGAYENFNAHITEFVLEVWIKATQDSKERGSGRIMGEHLHALLHEKGLFPYTVLPSGNLQMMASDSEKSFVLKRFNLDAFRDTALHWESLLSALRIGFKDQLQLLSLDAHAAEVLAEVTTVYAVSIMHVAIEDRATTSEIVLATSEIISSSAQKLRDALRLELKKPADRKSQDVPKAVRAYRDIKFDRLGISTNFHFRHNTSGWFKRLGTKSRRPEIFAGAGVAVADVDGDGFEDIFMLGSDGNRLFKNLGGFQFKDVTVKAGLQTAGKDLEDRGAYFFDYDNDGDPDLLVTNVDNTNRLYRNRGDGSYEDVTRESGLFRSKIVSHSAAIFDYDLDGDLDIYIACYGNISSEVTPWISNARNGQSNILYSNNGDGTFSDVTDSAAVGGAGWSHSVIAVDYNLDRKPDIFVVNDFGQSTLYKNTGKGYFVDVSTEAGLDYSANGISASFFDYNADGYPDLYVSANQQFVHQTKYVWPWRKMPMKWDDKSWDSLRMLPRNMLFENNRDGTFTEATNRMMEAGLTGWSWDADFEDFNNDGYPEIYVANGRHSSSAYGFQQNVLYSLLGNKFQDVSRNSGLDIISNTRAAAYADFDKDGRVDMVLNNYEDEAVLLANRSEAGHWLNIELLGTCSNRDGIGTSVELIAGGRTQYLHSRIGSGYLSQKSRILHFGVGDVLRVEQLHVIWPLGSESTFEDLAVDQTIRILEKCS